MEISKYNIELINKIKVLYTEKFLSCNKISKILNCSPAFVRVILIDAQVNLRPTGAVRKYNLNTNFLDNMENWDDKQSYFFGWLMTDGSNNILNRAIRISLQESDKAALNYLKKLISYAGPLLFQKRKSINLDCCKSYQDRFALQIASKEFSIKAEELGIFPHNSDIMPFPENLSELNYPHILRSIYEGDGTISYSKRYGKGYIFDIDLLGSKALLSKVDLILKKNCGIKNTRLEKPKGIQNKIHKLSFSGIANALQIFVFLYKDCCFCLKRKFRKFLRMINHFKRKKQKNKTQQQIYDILPEAIEVAKDIIRRKCY